jgi:uncharacterized lipoprotein
MEFKKLGICMKDKIIRLSMVIAILSVLSACSALKATDNRYQAYQPAKPLVLHGDLKNNEKPLYQIPAYKPTKPANAGVSILPPGSQIAAYQKKQEKSADQK